MNVNETIKRTRKRRIQKAIDTVLGVIVMIAGAAFLYTGARIVNETQTDTTNTILIVAAAVMIAGVIGLNREERK